MDLNNLTFPSIILDAEDVESRWKLRLIINEAIEYLQRSQGDFIYLCDLFRPIEIKHPEDEAFITLPSAQKYQLEAHEIIDQIAHALHVPYPNADFIIDSWGLNGWLAIMNSQNPDEFIHQYSPDYNTMIGEIYKHIGLEYEDYINNENLQLDVHISIRIEWLTRTLEQLTDKE